MNILTFLGKRKIALLVLLLMALSFIVNSDKSGRLHVVGTMANAAEENSSRYYRQLVITKPKDESAFWSDAGAVTIKIGMTPPLNRERGDQIQVFFDGKMAGTGVEVTLTNVDRGTHEIRAEVLDKAGTRLIMSRTIRFTLHRHSILLPQGRQNK